MPCSRTLAEIARLLGLRVSPLDADRLVTGVTHDSRRVTAGDLYAALPGAARHGAEFADEARRRGAVAALSDRPVAGLPTLLVGNPRRVLGPLASHLHADPSASLTVHAVTGTNGKTSTAHLLEAGLTAAGRCTGLLSTVVSRGAGPATESVRTTPEAPDLQAALAAMRDAGCTDAVVEASSHGLDLARMDGTCVRTGVFTNLSRDHLDHHGDMEHYFAAKASLFTPERCERAVVSVDDRWGRRLAATTRCPVVTFSTDDGDADWRASDICADATGTTFRMRGPGVDRAVRLRLLGRHQVSNALGATAALVADGTDVDDVLRGLEALEGVPGRLERVDEGQPFAVFVDYAHNPAASAQVYEFLRGVTKGRLLVVLGAAGERDHGKRGLLAGTAAAAADLVVITDESPHGEDPRHIRAELTTAALATAGRGDVVVVPGRAEGLARVLDEARAGDTVVVGGRGHERWLYRHGCPAIEFDDRAVLTDLLRSVSSSVPNTLPYGVRRSAADVDAEVDAEVGAEVGAEVDAEVDVQGAGALEAALRPAS